MRRLGPAYVLFVWTVFSWAAPSDLVHTTHTGVTFKKVSEDELKLLGVQPEMFLGGPDGEAWQEPDRTKKVGADLVLRDGASTLEYSGLETYSGRVWGDSIVERDGSPRLFSDLRDAREYCLKSGAVLPSGNDFMDLRAHLGAKWDNTDGKLYTNTKGYRHQVLPHLVYTKVEDGITFILGPHCYLADDGFVFDGSNGELHRGYCPSKMRDHGGGYEVRCMLPGKLKGAMNTAFGDSYLPTAGIDSIPAAHPPSNHKEKYLGYRDANRYQPADPTQAPSSTYPTRYAKKALGDSTSNPTARDSDHWVVPYRGDASHPGARDPYIYQPRSYYEPGSMRERRYKN